MIIDLKKILMFSGGLNQTTFIGEERIKGGIYTGWAKKTGPLCSAEILLRSARFFCRNQSRLILNTKT